MVGQTSREPQRVIVPEPGRYVAVGADDYLDARLDEWAAHEAPDRVAFFARLVHVDKACVDILGIIDSMYPGKYHDIAPLLVGHEADETAAV